MAKTYNDYELVRSPFVILDKLLIIINIRYTNAGRVSYPDIYKMYKQQLLKLLYADFPFTIIHLNS
jgi:hypothetical protein